MVNNFVSFIKFGFNYYYCYYIILVLNLFENVFGKAAQRIRLINNIREERTDAIAKSKKFKYNKSSYLENTLEKTLWLESPVFGADSVLSVAGFASPVNPSTQVSGYDNRFSILFFLLSVLRSLLVLLCCSLLSSTLKLTLDVFLRLLTMSGAPNDVACTAGLPMISVGAMVIGGTQSDDKTMSASLYVFFRATGGIMAFGSRISIPESWQFSFNAGSMSATPVGGSIGWSLIDDGAFSSKLSSSIDLLFFLFLRNIQMLFRFFFFGKHLNLHFYLSLLGTAQWWSNRLLRRSSKLFNCLHKSFSDASSSVFVSFANAVEINEFLQN